MAIMTKGNRQIRVSEARKADYLKRGYNEIDEKGNVITRSTAGLSPEAQKEIDTLTADNIKLTAENEKLRAEAEALKQETAAAKAEIGKLTAENEKLCKEVEVLKKK